MSFKEAYENYLIFASKQQKKQSFDCLTYNFNANILSYFDNYDLFDITLSDIESWQDFILKKNFSNNYNKRLLSMFKSFLSFCVKRYKFDYSIFNNISSFPLNYESKKSDFYTLAEFKRFIKFVDNNVYKQFFTFLFFTGVRPGEAMALKFSDLKDDFVVIDKTIDSHGNRSVGTPKTFSSYRNIYLDKFLIRDLLKLKRYYAFKFNDRLYDYYIFGGIKPLAPTTINRYKFRACELANIRPITLHQFRHSHASLLFNKNLDLHLIQKRLGHSKVSTTLDVYTHSYLNNEKRVQSTLNDLRFNFFDCLTYNFKKIISLLKHFNMF